jgi:uridylate kinase
VLKATKVDGVYDADPVRNPGARLFHELRYREVLERDLRVMDATAITMCQENHLPIRVFNIAVPGNIARAVRGEAVGTLVH